MLDLMRKVGGLVRSLIYGTGIIEISRTRSNSRIQADTISRRDVVYNQRHHRAFCAHDLGRSDLRGYQIESLLY
jgi:hypothetical protein